MKLIEDHVKSYLELEVVDENTVVFGRDSTLDSFALVSLIIDIEQSVFDEYGKEITIASEKAMSMSRSPFSTVKTLTDFVQSLIEET